MIVYTDRNVVTRLLKFHKVFCWFFLIITAQQTRECVQQVYNDVVAVAQANIDMQHIIIHIS